MQIGTLITRLFRTTSTKMNAAEIGRSMPKYTYEQLKDALKRPEAVVIDVREPKELKETGVIPGSINIPVGSIEKAFSQTGEETFKKEYGRDKPGKDTEIVVSCRSGKRSELVQNILVGLGFKKVYNYAGGWLDWEEHLKSG